MLLGTSLSLRILYIKSFLAALKAPLISMHTSVFQVLQLFLPSYFISRSASILKAISVIDLPKIPPTQFSLNYSLLSPVSPSHFTSALSSPLLVTRRSVISLQPFTMLISLFCLGIRTSLASFRVAFPSLKSLLMRWVTLYMSGSSSLNRFIITLSRPSASFFAFRNTTNTTFLFRLVYLARGLTFPDLVQLFTSNFITTRASSLTKVSIITVTYVSFISSLYLTSCLSALS